MGGLLQEQLTVAQAKLEELVRMAGQHGAEGTAPRLSPPWLAAAHLASHRC